MVSEREEGVVALHLPTESFKRNAHTLTLPYRQDYIHTNTHTYIHTHTNKDARAHARTNTYTHTHTGQKASCYSESTRLKHYTTKAETEM